ncbi:hypothetical protein [Citrobacter freundii]|uniref:hypothetical protein n=1 Tax=Citrobacter freundii TaxID=546 RepID=UPI002245355F|nr:hypothetical protein [Citrobacter freundii]MCX2444527.1 hypothetical protein [Citrobacter freundii]MCX2472598.1 hypothetical protein [Citrobacter freundii]UZQ88487.1 hypothetical protein OQW59_20140 [Citrobacter freundii]UZQ94825.1 hypothetical protein OQY67_24600 [Citrobacter freundii]UZQ99330.1 hypothetical protein OQZ20_20270 [Citrobacter freundii]
MPSLGQLYNDKDAGLTTRKTYNVPLDKIYAEEGYNVRELNRKRRLSTVWSRIQDPVT